MLTLTKISFKVSLNSVKNISGQSKAVLMHHGMLGSGRNFRPLVNNSDTFNSVDTILIDSRNHGSK